MSAIHWNFYEDGYANNMLWNWT